jgi:hypothetical protein
MNVLLIESGMNRLKQNRPNLALARFSTLYKSLSDKVYHVIFKGEETPIPVIPDKIIASAIFSWDVPRLINYIQQIQGKNPDVEIAFGGIGTLNLQDYIYDRLGIYPISTCLENMDLISPDPEFFIEDAGYAFCSRGCPLGCNFCGVKDFEGRNTRIIPNWKEQLDYSKKYWVFMDNNPLSLPTESREDLFSLLKEHCSGQRLNESRKIRECSFDSGFDFRRIDKETIRLIKGLRLSSIKLAWDKVGYEDQFVSALRMLQEAFPHVSKRGMYEQFQVYVLYNHEDTLEDTLYRINKLYHEYRVFPTAMRYQPFGSMIYKDYLDPNWTSENAVDIARWANKRAVFMSTSFDLYQGRLADGRSISNFKTLPELDLFSVGVPDGRAVVNQASKKHCLAPAGFHP